MSLNAVVGQLLREGMSPSSRSRLEHSTGPRGLGGLDASGGLAAMLNSMLGGSAAERTAGGGGDLLGGIGSILSADSGIGGMSRGEVGGLGAIAGALLGGRSVKGAIGGGAMALLGTLALSALKNWQSQSAGAPADTPKLSPLEIQQMTAPETAELCLRGMIEAVKSDGAVAPEEIGRITGKLQEDGITAEEQRFVMAQLSKPADVEGLIAAIPNREIAAQVYAAALMAISVDTEAERAFLARLAQGTGLGAEPVRNLHTMVGAPTLSA